MGFGMITDQQCGGWLGGGPGPEAGRPVGKLVGESQ